MRRKQGKIVHNLFLLLFVLGLLELASVALYRVLFHSWFSYREVSAMLESATLEEAHELKNVIAGSLVIPHPYLGFVYDSRQKVKHGELSISSFGFIDDKDPIQKRSPEKVIVGIFGGSVAWWFQSLGGNALKEELQRHPELQNKEIVFVRVALGAYKQPQQLQTLAYLLSLGAEFDIIINIDGFNEVTLPRFEVPQFPFYPRNWSTFMQYAPEKSTLRLIAWTEQKKERRAYSAGFLHNTPLRYSATACTLWALWDRHLQTQLTELRTALKSSIDTAIYTSPAATGPLPKFPNRESFYRGLALVWRQSSTAMARLSAAYGIKYFHFLQPNQYVPNTKEMDDQERAIAISDDPVDGESVKIGYPLLQEQAQTLQSEGINFSDATMIFKDLKEAGYVDNCCHLSEIGNQIFGRFVGQQIVRALAQQ